MAHDVLISYSHQDKHQADAICNRLESKGIRCWIAPRDVPLGTEYADSIVKAIERAKVMVLVFSANADESHQVRREVERAVSKGTAIVPVRIEDAKMSKALELYVSQMHWLDAITPPLEKHIDKLAHDLKAFLSGRGASPITKERSLPRPAMYESAAAPASRQVKWKGRLRQVGLIVGSAVLFLGGFGLEGGDRLRHWAWLAASLALVWWGSRWRRRPKKAARVFGTIVLILGWVGLAAVVIPLFLIVMVLLASIE